MINTDIAVIGGGASGLVAAISAAREYNCKIIILERLSRVGKKILATGNGRCNLGNENISIDKFHGDTVLTKDIIKNFDTENFFESIGLYCRHDDEGRIYPYSNTATSVLDALRLEIARYGITELCDFEVKSIQKSGKTFIITSDNETVSAKKVILSAGGYAAPSMGTDGSGIRLVKDTHKSAPPFPALCPVKTLPELTKPLKGIRINGNASIIVKDKLIKSEHGEIQFSDGAISGICIFNLSSLAAEYGKCAVISLDIMSEYSENQILTILDELKSQRGYTSLENLLSGLFHKRVGQVLLKNVTDNIPLTEPCSKLDKSALSRLAHLIKNWRFPVTGLSAYNAAQVTMGGILLSEMDKNLQSRYINGLYFCGEILNINGDCGGYNLHWAWSSGYHTGKNAAASLKG